MFTISKLKRLLALRVGLRLPGLTSTRSTKVMLAKFTLVTTALLLLIPQARAERERPKHCDQEEKGYSVAILGTRYGCGGVRPGHTTVFACDDEPNGWGVRTHYRLKNDKPGDKSRKVGDPNGSDGNCGERPVTNSDNPVVFYSVSSGPGEQKREWRNCTKGKPACEVKK